MPLSRRVDEHRWQVTEIRHQGRIELFLQSRLPKVVDSLPLRPDPVAIRNCDAKGVHIIEVAQRASEPSSGRPRNVGEHDLRVGSGGLAVDRARSSSCQEVTRGSTGSTSTEESGFPYRTC